MANENVQMWTELNIDLKSHDMLLSALGPIFQEVYLSQKNRPAGMGFYDFVVGDIHGIRVRELREHAKNGGKVVATYCVFSSPKSWSGRPMLFRLDYAPVLNFRYRWRKKVLPRNTCALIKSSFGFRLGRVCPYVQASHLIVGETTATQEENVRAIE